MSYYPPAGTHQSIVYPGTPGPMLSSGLHYPGTPIAPGTLAPQHLSPNVLYVPSRSNSRSSRHHDDDYDRRHSRSHSDSHGHGHSRSSGSRRHRRHESDGHKHRRSHSRRHRDRSPQVVMVQPQPGVMPVHNAYSYYRPTWTERLRQFFGFSPVSQQYRHKSNTHSWGFFGRSRRPRYVDPYSGTEVDRYGRPVMRI